MAQLNLDHDDIKHIHETYGRRMGSVVLLQYSDIENFAVRYRTFMVIASRHEHMVRNGFGNPVS